MKIVILGAGQVGASVAESLVSEHNDLTVVDLDATRLRALQDRLDLRTVTGSASHPSVLVEAGIEDADLLVAVTQSDETNLVACKIASRLFNVPRRIARVRATDFLNDEKVLGPEGFEVDLSICPEQVLTDYIVKLVEFPEALQVLDFAGGRVSLVAVRAYRGGPLVGHPIRDLRQHIPGVDTRVVAIFRKDAAVAPDGNTAIEANDEVFCLAATKDIRQVMRELRRMDQPVRRVMIAGGGNIGLRLARALEDDYSVRIIDHNKRRCEMLAAKLDRALVLNGDGTDEELLEQESIGEMDLFVAVTNDDENNIMSSLLAKRLGARRVVALINRRSYVDLVQGAQIDIAISPAQATIGKLLAHVRRGDVVAVHSLRRGAAEALEAVVHGDRDSCRLTGRRIEEIELPPGTNIGAIVRGEEVLMAHHDTRILAEDHVIVFVTDKKILPRVEKLFQVGARFL
ncbi:MAG: Trk system potassium transport protein TrkA [Betaproteobacteria bacterium RIFCSPLOWO2_12_FULL_67_28]|nr:MAG: Trk system potassium transport protein TrkA [Betaproteobacteria bacterium RIFCSPLOWO2_12_FULL_67_28]